MIHHKYLDRSSPEYLAFCEFIKDNHPDPDIIVESQDKWFWLYKHMMHQVKLHSTEGYRQGFKAALESLNSAFDSVDKRLRKINKS